MPTIASLIREKLYNSPNGATTQEIAAYCVRKGATFKTQNIQKSVSGQLSKMNLYYYDVGGYYVWSIYPKSYMNTNISPFSQTTIPDIDSTKEKTSDTISSNETSFPKPTKGNSTIENIISDETIAIPINNDYISKQNDNAIEQIPQDIKNDKSSSFGNIVLLILIILLSILSIFVLIFVLKNFMLVLAAIILFLWFYIVTS